MAHTGFEVSFVLPRLQALLGSFEYGYDSEVQNWEWGWKNKVRNYKDRQSHANWFVLRFRGRDLCDEQAEREFYKLGNEDWAGYITNERAKAISKPTKCERHKALLRMIDAAVKATQVDEDPIIYLDDNEMWVFDYVSNIYHRWNHHEADKRFEGTEE